MLEARHEPTRARHDPPPGQVVGAVLGEQPTDESRPALPPCICCDIAVAHHLAGPEAANDVEQPLVAAPIAHNGAMSVAS